MNLETQYTRTSMDETDCMNLSRDCLRTVGEARAVRDMRAADSVKIFQLRIRRVILSHKLARTPFASAVAYETMLTISRAAITSAS